MAELHVGDVVTAKKFGPFEHDFGGELEKVYENSALVLIDDYNDGDSMTVSEMNRRAVVKNDDITVIKAAPVPEPDPEEETDEDDDKK
ncbi:hypothetical protein [Furfurilactobacillus siliginis]|uniref:DUF2187 domain-containing protein n=1 Tax=Furfurilactobacillus siliginis TaxID=348151 RepID=A0A0R2L612_9LACO|nr:hypothetical protein [Furfurilactobacillus siliginis]KRN94698.1 hypothetical protein IV55_GL000467 [Furfurilactobacillus siliginis]GEK28410.1 hypothetical protein LSI01_07210 [Furfurilactobacillus siliginis]